MTLCYKEKMQKKEVKKNLQEIAFYNSSVYVNNKIKLLITDKVLNFNICTRELFIHTCTRIYLFIYDIYYK